MLRIIAKLILTFTILAWVLVALVEVYPEQVKKAEAVLWLEIVVPIQDFISDIKNKIYSSTTLNQQRSIEEIVDNEIER